MALLYCLRLVTLVPKINPEAIPDKQLSKDLEQIKKRTGDYRTAYGATANSLEKVVNQTSLALENVDPDLIENHTILVERTDQTFIVIQNIKQQIRDIFDYIDNLVDDAENQLQQKKKKMTKNTFSTIIEILSLEQIDILINTYFSKLERLLQLLVALTVLVIVFAFTLRRKDGKRIVIPYVIMALLYCLRLVTLVPKVNPEAIPDKQLSKDLEQIKKRA